MSLIFHTSNGEVFEYDGENLYHFGIKGMKWGVRRYQNPDGSLTPAGKARYAKLEKKYKKASAKFNKYRKKANEQAYVRKKIQKDVERLRKAGRSNLATEVFSKVGSGMMRVNEASYNLMATPSAAASTRYLKRMRELERKKR